MTKHLYLFAGLIALGLGAIGAAVPLLPAFPFLLLASICFAKSSDRLYQWFISTKLYKNNLESYVKGKGMTMRTKNKIIATVTVLMGFGFTIMMIKEVYIPCVILACVWIFHIIYFFFGVKTLKAE